MLLFCFLENEYEHFLRKSVDNQATKNHCKKQVVG